MLKTPSKPILVYEAQDYSYFKLSATRNELSAFICYAEIYNGCVKKVYPPQNVTSVNL